MCNEVQEIIDFWKEEEPKYRCLGKLVETFIKHNISECEILPEISYRTKELLSIIKKVKKNVDKGKGFYKNLTDKLGVRIICSFQEELPLINSFLHKYFVVVKTDYKKENLDFNELNYISNHYDVKINCGIREFKKYAELETYIFEIQVRTLNQHSWSNSAHTLSYKQEEDLPLNLKRKLYRLLSLYEIADDELSAVNTALKLNQNNLVYSLLRKLEGKFYKFAKIDFDREISLEVIRILLDYLPDMQKQTILNEIEIFIEEHKRKIQNIYNENRNRFFNILFLTQPEIFIVWYMLVKNKSLIEDNWENELNGEDLEQIRTLWGSEL